MADPPGLPLPIESALLRVLDGPSIEWNAGIEQLCSQHRDHGPAIRAMAATVQQEFAGLEAPRNGGGAASGSADPQELARGTCIGHYKILDTLGHGGMGTVYLAEQREPVRRRVALKVIKLGMDSKAVLARFEAERRALSMMEHSCIATVLDAGVSAQGQPYFVMEYVKGIPITDYCDQNKLSLKERIELFQKVCSGVQHAHLKGVMHRDLKPSNVLVTLQDGKPTPKIIDFGLAKATDHHLVEATLFTEQGVMIGTPEYMSPEQAGLGGLDVDTRTDVYSLGVLLYELLVGELPFSRKELRHAGFLEMQRVIREQEPTKPSTRITTLGDAAGQHAAARQLAIGDLQKHLRGDLDWIVLRAIEKDRTRRYETAQELAADLGRHMNFEPVLASPPSLGYRVKKFVRKYRLQCAAAAVALVAIVGGGTLAVWGFSEAKQQERIAKEQEKLATDRATQIAGMLQKERQANEENRIYADLAQLAEARAIEATLYPAFPDKVQVMKDWLATYGEPLASRLPELKAALQTRRGTATLLPQPREPDPQSHPLHLELQRRQAELETEFDTARRSWLRERIAAIECEIEVAGLTFAEGTSAYVHGKLTQLVKELGEFVDAQGQLQRVKSRLVEATTVKQRTIDAHAADWEKAIAAIQASDDRAASKLYEHFTLTPQMGLVPIGMDRESRLWEFVHLASGTPGKEIPARDEQTGRLLPTGEMGLVFVLLPAGTLPVEDGRQARPVNDMRLDPFFVSKYEMTRGQWLRLTNASFSDGLDPVLPVADVNWFDCDELLRQQGLVLPSELRCEYACRGGTTTTWWTGAKQESLAGKENVDGKMNPVGSLAPNPFGLFDVSGNLWEWCLDASLYRVTGLSPELPDSTTHRACRGGGFDTRGRAAPSSGSLGLAPTQHLFSHGVRAARSVRP